MTLTDISRIRYLHQGVEKVLAGPRATKAVRNSINHMGVFTLDKIEGRITIVEYNSKGRVIQARYDDYIEQIASRTLKT